MACNRPYRSPPEEQLGRLGWDFGRGMGPVHLVGQVGRGHEGAKTCTGTPFHLVAAPVQFDEEPAVPIRARFNEPGERILTDLGFDEDAIIDLKIRGIMA
jgi:hypothetical protein